jgi:hypothetical protein
MKKLFKSMETEERYSDVITQVHTEFATAGEKLYQEALLIINSQKILNDEKVQRLINLGFTATKEVIEAETIIKNRKINEKIVKQVSYYRENYPFQKFITQDQVTIICKKYGLIQGSIDQYTGFVPEKNLKTMESFELKERDAKKLSYNAGFDNQFQIAAPQKDFKISDRQEVKNHKIVDKPVPDPVILAPVVGGFLIVTAWGDEASDPLIVNEINN